MNPITEEPFYQEWCTQMHTELLLHYSKRKFTNTIKIQQIKRVLVVLQKLEDFSLNAAEIPPALLDVSQCKARADSKSGSPGCPDTFKHLTYDSKGLHELRMHQEEVSKLQSTYEKLSKQNCSFAEQKNIFQKAKSIIFDSTPVGHLYNKYVPDKILGFSTKSIPQSTQVKVSEAQSNLDNINRKKAERELLTLQRQAGHIKNTKESEAHDKIDQKYANDDKKQKARIEASLQQYKMCTEKKCANNLEYNSNIQKHTGCSSDIMRKFYTHFVSHLELWITQCEKHDEIWKEESEIFASEVNTWLTKQKPDTQISNVTVVSQQTKPTKQVIHRGTPNLEKAIIDTIKSIQSDPVYSDKFLFPEPTLEGDVCTQITPYQRFVHYMAHPELGLSLLFYHDMGTGKTCSMIYAVHMLLYTYYQTPPDSHNTCQMMLLFEKKDAMQKFAVSLSWLLKVDRADLDLKSKCTEVKLDFTFQNQKTEFSVTTTSNSIIYRKLENGYDVTIVLQNFTTNEFEWDWKAKRKRSESNYDDLLPTSSKFSLLMCDEAHGLFNPSSVKAQGSAMNRLQAIKFLLSALVTSRKHLKRFFFTGTPGTEPAHILLILYYLNADADMLPEGCTTEFLDVFGVQGQEKRLKYEQAIASISAKITKLWFADGRLKPEFADKCAWMCSYVSIEHDHNRTPQKSVNLPLGRDGIYDNIHFDEDTQSSVLIEFEEGSKQLVKSSESSDLAKEYSSFMSHKHILVNCGKLLQKKSDSKVPAVQAAASQRAAQSLKLMIAGADLNDKHVILFPRLRQDRFDVALSTLIHAGVFDNSGQKVELFLPGYIESYVNLNRNVLHNAEIKQRVDIKMMRTTITAEILAYLERNHRPRIVIFASNGRQGGSNLCSDTHLPALKALYNSSQNASGQIIQFVLGDITQCTGTDFLNTRFLHLYSPPSSLDLLMQAEKRHVRNCGQKDLLPQNRKAFVILYLHKGDNIDTATLSTEPEPIKSVNTVSAQLLKAMKQNALDCVFNSGQDCNNMHSLMPDGTWSTKTVKETKPVTQEPWKLERSAQHPVLLRAKQKSLSWIEALLSEYIEDSDLIKVCIDLPYTLDVNANKFNWKDLVMQTSFNFNIVKNMMIDIAKKDELRMELRNILSPVKDSTHPLDASYNKQYATFKSNFIDTLQFKQRIVEQSMRQLPYIIENWVDDTLVTDVDNFIAHQAFQKRKSLPPRESDIQKRSSNASNFIKALKERVKTMQNYIPNLDHPRVVDVSEQVYEISVSDNKSFISTWVAESLLEEDVNRIRVAVVNAKGKQDPGFNDFSCVVYDSMTNVFEIFTSIVMDQLEYSRSVEKAGTNSFATMLFRKRAQTSAVYELVLSLLQDVPMTGAGVFHTLLRGNLFDAICARVMCSSFRDAILSIFNEVEATRLNLISNAAGGCVSMAALRLDWDSTPPPFFVIKEQIAYPLFIDKYNPNSLFVLGNELSLKHLYVGITKNAETEQILIQVAPDECKLLCSV